MEMTSKSAPHFLITITAIIILIITLVVMETVRPLEGCCASRIFSVTRMFFLFHISVPSHPDTKGCCLDGGRKRESESEREKQVNEWRRRK